jgi:hypothetical protein
MDNYGFPDFYSRCFSVKANAALYFRIRQTGKNEQQQKDRQENFQPHRSTSVNIFFEFLHVIVSRFSASCCEKNLVLLQTV